MSMEAVKDVAILAGYSILPGCATYLAPTVMNLLDRDPQSLWKSREFQAVLGVGAGLILGAFGNEILTGNFGTELDRLQALVEKTATIDLNLNPLQLIINTPVTETIHRWSTRALAGVSSALIGIGGRALVGLANRN